MRADFRCQGLILGVRALCSGVRALWAGRGREGAREQGREPARESG